VPGGDFDFGEATSIDAEAIGPPGQRRFRLTVLSEERSASLWLEKEQLAALSTAIEQQLVRSDRRRRLTEPPPDDAPPPFPLNADVDLRVGQLALGYDEARSLFVVQAAAVDSESRERADFSCTANHRQARGLIQTISKLMASGRPTCPLCGAVIEGEHHCPRSNGHAEVAIL
jgi:uncharacterized repeat protein (TIGR03847 family)